MLHTSITSIGAAFPICLGIHRTDVEDDPAHGNPELALGADRFRFFPAGHSATPESLRGPKIESCY